MEARLVLAWLLAVTNCLGHVGGACTFPTDLQSKTFVSNTLGEVNFINPSSLTLQEGLRNCPNTLCPPANVRFDCIEKQTENYMLRSEERVSGSDTFYLYTCLYLREVRAGKWVYYQGPERSIGTTSPLGKNTYFNAYVTSQQQGAAQPITFSQVCNLTSPLRVQRYSLLLDKDTLTSQSTACPDAMLKTFTTTSTSSCSAQFDVCSTNTRQTVVINDTSCSSDNFFASSAGKMDCVHSLAQDGVTYVTMYTPDSSPLNFSCLAYTETGSNLYVTQNDDNCNLLQLPNSTVHDFLLQSTVLCPFPCELPAALNGSWVSSAKGAVSLSPTSLQGIFTCPSSTCGQELDTLECYRTENDVYLLRTAVTTIASQSVRVYMCVDITMLTSTKFLYRKRHIANQTTLNDYVVTFNSGQSVDLTQACDDMTATVYQASRYHLLLKEGSEESSFSACPAALGAIFENTDTSCSSELQVCTSPKVISITGSTCSPKPLFSDSGSLGCLHSIVYNGATYLTLYNTNSSSSGTSAFDFVCVVMAVSGTTLSLSQNPLIFLDSQTATEIDSVNGAAFTYTRTSDCPVTTTPPPTTNGNNGGNGTTTDDDSSSLSSSDLIIIIVVIVLLVIIIIIVIIIVIICCRKKRAAARRKRSEDKEALRKEMEEEEGLDIGSNFSMDSGYPSTPGGDSRGRERGRPWAGTPRSHHMLVYGIEEEEGVRNPAMTSRRRHGGRRHRRRILPGKDGQQEYTEQMDGYGTDDEDGYSDASWEEYVDEDGNVQMRQRPRSRRRRRKVVQHRYTRTKVLPDGTTVEEEVVSEFSVTDSSEDEWSDGQRGDISQQIREAKQKRKDRFTKIMAQDKGAPLASITSTAIVTRDMDEKANQPERKRRSFWNKLRLRARDRKSKTKVRKRGFYELKGGKGAGERGEEKHVPYLRQYQTKKQIERALHDEGFFDDPQDKVTAETTFGFDKAQRELSPKPEADVTCDADDERVASASSSSQSENEAERAELERYEADMMIPGIVRHKDDDKGVKDVRGQGQGRRVTIMSASSVGSSSSSVGSLSKDSDDSDVRKDSDTSSGVADLSSPDRQLSSPEHHDGQQTGEMRRESHLAGRERGRGVQALDSRRRGQKEDGGDKRRGSRDGHHRAKKAKEEDKRVKTALRRLLNDRLFGSGSDQKKSRRDDDTTGNAVIDDSLDHDVSVVSSKTATRQAGRLNEIKSRGKPNAAPDTQRRTPRRLAFVEQQRLQESTNDLGSENDSLDEGRRPTGSGAQLPPLRTPKRSAGVFTPAHYPKWGLCVTASQRSLLTDGLHRDRTFLSRQRARTAWDAKMEDDVTFSPHSVNSTGTPDDESLQDPHRPDDVSTGGPEDSRVPGVPWARKRPVPDHSSMGSGSVAFTHSSGRSPLDMDDRRLRRLLEELYRDKKFMDKLINNIDQELLGNDYPDHIAADDVKFLSEFGRHYLLERAQYWEVHGPLGPPRPPPTALGLRLQRSQTSMTGDNSYQSSQANMESPRPKTVR